MLARPVVLITALSLTVTTGSALNLLNVTVPDGCRRMCEPVVLLSGACTRAESGVFPPLARVPCEDDPEADDPEVEPPASVWSPPSGPANRTVILKVSLPFSGVMLSVAGAFDPIGVLASLLNNTLPVLGGKGKGNGKGIGMGNGKSRPPGPPIPPRPPRPTCEAERQRLERTSFQNACYCQNRSFDVANISGLCADCAFQKRGDSLRARKDSERLVDGITIVALMPTRVASPPSQNGTQGGLFAPAAAPKPPPPTPVTSSSPSSSSTVSRNPDVPTITAIPVPAPQRLGSGSARPVSVLHFALVQFVALSAWLV
ncbi:hypothetical protein MAPG_01322 [Magnaporthiopsis poae ATCC 64411]|uniref:Uncharacterized protein n=1 Tax=Magnaporthiopsis poae (strain ATCC 64411 / 73-15) TaxID=644358 RepID=A0A0C4DNE1_MAGP6|nr:hypothetical protein MAPG_01322 [Magnaporthiopsis poae ATCC 64411]